MNRGSTVFLRVVISLIGIGALALCIFVLPGIASRDAAANPDTAYYQYPFLISAYILFIPFVIALFQAYKLLSYLDKNIAFSEYSVKALKNIKNCAIIICSIIVLGMLFVAFVMEGDRAGVIMLGLILSIASSIIITIAAILQKHVQNAVELKSEIDLTV